MKIGNGSPCYIIAEIGINHNGDLQTALDLVKAAKAAGANAVKFQKRTPELAVPDDQKGVMKDTPWGRMTYLEYKQRIEFNYWQYAEIDKYCKLHNIDWFASVWDVMSARFMEDFKPPYYKIASASLTDDRLLSYTRESIKPIILSTGMSTLAEIDHAVDILRTGDLILLHCVSSYPAYNPELNLRVIPALKARYGVPVGYSGHEVATITTVAAVALGACVVERHITLDKTMWGSDQNASLEPAEFAEMVRDIRWVEEAMGDGVKRVLPREVPIMQKLRRVVA